MSARVDTLGKMVRLGSKAGTPSTLTETDAQDPVKVAQVMTDVLANVAEQASKHVPEFIEFEDVVIAINATVRLPHHFGARVRWWLTDWLPNVTGDQAILERSASTTSDVLVLLVSGGAGKVCIRVERAG